MPSNELTIWKDIATDLTASKTGTTSVILKALITENSIMDRLLSYYAYEGFKPDQASDLLITYMRTGRK